LRDRLDRGRHRRRGCRGGSLSHRSRRFLRTNQTKTSNKNGMDVKITWVTSGVASFVLALATTKQTGEGVRR